MMRGARAAPPPNPPPRAARGVRGLSDDWHDRLQGARGGLAISRVKSPRPPLGVKAGLVHGDWIAINRAGSHAEAVLHRERDARGKVLLQFGERNEDVAVIVGMVKVVTLVHQAASRNHEARCTSCRIPDNSCSQIPRVGAAISKHARLPVGGQHEFLKWLSGIQWGFPAGESR